MAHAQGCQNKARTPGSRWCHVVLWSLGGVWAVTVQAANNRYLLFLILYEIILQLLIFWSVTNEWESKALGCWVFPDANPVSISGSSSVAGIGSNSKNDCKKVCDADRATPDHHLLLLLSVVDFFNAWHNEQRTTWEWRMKRQLRKNQKITGALLTQCSEGEKKMGASRAIHYATDLAMVSMWTFFSLHCACASVCVLVCLARVLAKRRVCRKKGHLLRESKRLSARFPILLLSHRTHSNVG